jgi:UDP-N-acetylglucosamine acyltransferase
MPDPMIHPTASIAPGARLGAGVQVGAFAVIEEDVIIGDACRIAAHAVIKRHTRMGARNRVGEHAVIGGDPQDFKFSPDTLSYTEIGDDNVMREGVTVHRGSRPDSATRIGNGCFLMATAHVAHDCMLGNHVIMANTATLGGEVVIFDRAFLSGAVNVHQFCRVGRNAMIGGCSKITQDCLPFCITDGNPSRARGLNLVGLRRSGFAAADIAALKDAYRMLHQHLPLATAIERMKASPSAPVLEIAAFLESGKRGFAHPGTRTSAG